MGLAKKEGAVGNTAVIGSAALHNVDCLEAMRKMPDKAFSLAIVDPPYGIGVGKAQKGKWISSRMPKKDWDNGIPAPEYFAELQRVSHSQIIWGGNYFPLPPSRCFVVWDKGAGFKGRDFAECELAWTSYDANAKIYHRDPLACRDYIDKIHPTQKPVNLYKYLLRHFAKEGDTILDTHHGSGSLSIACLDMGYSITAYELDPDYFAASVERIQRSQQQLKLAL